MECLIFHSIESCEALEPLLFFGLATSEEYLSLLTQIKSQIIENYLVSERLLTNSRYIIMYGGDKYFKNIRKTCQRVAKVLQHSPNSTFNLNCSQQHTSLYYFQMLFMLFIIFLIIPRSHAVFTYKIRYVCAIQFRHSRKNVANLISAFLLRLCKHWSSNN